MLRLALAMVCCAFWTFCLARSALSASAALSLVALSAATRCCSGVLGLITTSCICMWVFMPNFAMVFKWLYLPLINKQHDAAEENCIGTFTTDSEQRPPLFGAQQLDIGVAGMEILCSSRDLVSLPVEDDVGRCNPIDTRINQAQRWQAQRLCITSKHCPHGNLRTLQTVGT